jgi:hypothetical protein
VTPLPPRPRGDEPCRNRPELFFASHPAHVEAAKRHCGGCRLLQECRDYGIAAEVYGVYGGLSPEERKQIRKRRGIVVNQPTIRIERRAPIDHGTEAGRKQHARRGIPIDPLDTCGCRRAQNLAREQRAKKQAS